MKKIILIILFIVLIIVGFFVIDNKFKESKPNIKEEENNNNNVIIDKYNMYNSINDIKFNGKVNIYFFWLEGCPICEEEIKYYEENYSKLNEKCNIYSFESHDKDNRNLLEDMAKELHEEIPGVPITIVGNKFLIGFNNYTIKLINEEINRQNKAVNKYDVYKKIKG